MSNLRTHNIQTSTVNFIFLKVGMVKLFKTLHITRNVKIKLFKTKIFEDITLLIFRIYSFIELKVSMSLSKFSMVHLTMGMHCD